MLIYGDCLDKMNEVEDSSVHLILTDLPYKITANKWDVIIPFELLWEHYERVLCQDGIVCLFGRQPFTSLIVNSNPKLYRYSWVWEKDTPSDFLNSAYKPLNKTEDICVFSRNTVGSLSKFPIRYFPQGVVEVNKKKKNNPNSNWRENKGYPKANNSLNSDKEYIQKYTNHPTNILKFPRDKPSFHPTQKPVALLEYLIKTYTLSGEIVLDSTMGSGSTGVAAKKTGRGFIGIEKDKKYFEISKKRIKES